MTVLQLVREVKFILAVLAICAISMIGFTVLLPERICETGGIYLGYDAPSEE